jgi:2-polyprenyl-6-methoxyphenol hydroxylase-like FAD-dependent oxidoreductase
VGTISEEVGGRVEGRIRTLIIGAGMAGMTLAALLRQRGERPVVVEREKLNGDLGYMMALYPQGSRVLHGLGLYEKYLSSTNPMRFYNIHNGHGKLIHAYPLEELTRRYGPLHAITRAHLVALLREAAADLPIHTGVTVERMEQNAEEVSVTFSDGSSLSFDLVVAADGLHSQTRKSLLAEDEYPYWDSGWGGWVFWSDPSLAPANTVTEYWGAGRFVWMYPVADRLGVFMGGPVHTLKKEGMADFTRHVRESFGMFGGAVPQIIDAGGLTEHTFFWEFHDCRSRHWRKGRVVFLGDSAAGFLPTAGVGASMAMESAAALSDELSRTNGRFVEQALDLYEKRHRKRVEAAQNDSRILARTVFVESLPLAWARNEVMKFMPVEMLIKDITRMIDEPI